MKVWIWILILVAIAAVAFFVGQQRGKNKNCALCKNGTEKKEVAADSGTGLNMAESQNPDPSKGPNGSGKQLFE